MATTIRVAHFPAAGEAIELAERPLSEPAVQYAVKMGFNTVAIARGADKEPFARELGASTPSTRAPRTCSRR